MPRYHVSFRADDPVRIPRGIETVVVTVAVDARHGNDATAKAAMFVRDTLPFEGFEFHSSMVGGES